MITLYNKLHDYGVTLKSQPISKIEADFIFTYEGQGYGMRSIYNFTHISSEKAEEILLDDLRCFITMYDLKPIPKETFKMPPKDPREIEPI